MYTTHPYGSPSYSSTRDLWSPISTISESVDNDSELEIIPGNDDHRQPSSAGENQTSSPKECSVLSERLCEHLKQLTASHDILYQALRDSSIIRKPTDSIILWVDALCINQEDREGRCHQVTLIGSESYPSVTRGYGDQETMVQAFKAHFPLRHSRLKLGVSPDLRRYSQPNEGEEKEELALAAKGIDSSSEEAIDSQFWRPVFNRKK